MLQDAAEKGARVVNLAPDQMPDAARRKLPPHMILEATDDMKIIQEEIFELRPVFQQGPISSIQLALQPPYGTGARRTLDWMFRLRG